VNYDSLPKNKPSSGLKFDTKAYQQAEAARVKMDLALAKIVMARQDLIDFLEVNKDGSITIMCYNPFGSYLNELEGMVYDFQEVSDKKTKAYTKASNDSIKWCIKVLSGDINLLFGFKLKKWFTEKNIKGEIEEFCKDVAMIIRFYPHIDMKNNEDYLAAFFEWFNELEEDDMMRMNVLDGIMEELKKCFFPDKREKYEKEGTLENEVRIFTSSIFIQDCSKKCHEKFIKLRIGSEKKKSFLDTIKSKGLARKAVIEAKLSGKRKRDDDGEDDSNKERKLEDGKSPSSKELLNLD